MNEDSSAFKTIEQMRVERDATVTAGLPTKYNQQTLVGNISGAGNRHVIEDSPVARRPINFPSQTFDGADSGCSPSAPPETGTWVWGSVDGTCQWIDTTDCSA